ncbi:MAG: ChaN family lipoprotein [Burkholderiales bacterium]
MSPSRRASLAWLALTDAPLRVGGDMPPDNRLIEVRTGRSITRAELLNALRASDFVLLGEQHDNPHHHARRAELLRALVPGTAVVAEHLPRGSRVAFGPDLLASLSAAGFEPQAWGWPLHRPLFAALAERGLPLSGGNLPRDDARRIAREGQAALPPDIAALLQAAGPLPPVARAALDADLVQGHCGHLSAGPRLDGLRWAQRARDASMALALQASGGAPAVLLAGNGHVRQDYGVAPLLAARQPGARIVSVGFTEPGDASDNAPFTYLWVTPAVSRDDPCKGFAMPQR